MADPGLAPNAFAEEFYERLAPLMTRDAENGYGGKTFAYALGSMMNQFELLARTDADGNPGWTIILDPTRAPDYALPYVAQYRGEVIPVGAPETDARAIVTAGAHSLRGTPQSLIDAATKHLTGSKYLTLRERDTGPRHATMYVRTAECTLAPGTYQVKRVNIGQGPIIASIFAVKPSDVDVDLVVATQRTIDELTGSIDALAGTIDQLST